MGFVELNGEKRNCRLRVEIVVETRCSNLTIRNRATFCHEIEFQIQSAERISGADMNFVE